jgi:hypothetical protein
MEYLPIPIIKTILSYMSGRELIELLKIKYYKKIYERYNKEIIIDLSYRPIEDIDLENLSNIHTIYLSGCRKITNRALRNLSNIDTIYLDWCNITDGGLKYLSNAQFIDISECENISDYGISFLKNVKKLNISNCNDIIGRSLKYLKNLEEINITGCYEIDEEEIMELKNIKKIIKYIY